MNRSAPWTIADVLDFESLLSADAAVPDDRLRERDRVLFVDQIAPKLPPEAAMDRRAVFREWLEVRRQQHTGMLPGEAYETGRQALMTASVVLGLISGVSVTLGLLHYSGNEPINAMLFLAWTLGPQWLFLIGGLLFTIERHTTRFLGRWGPLRALVAGLLWLFTTGMRKLPGEHRDALRAAIGGFGPKRDVYSPLINWPIMIVTQTFAVCFNLGVIGTVLAELPARELRFGWQTTLNVSSEQAARVVSAMATPWSGWAPHPYPSAQEVIATRYAPGQAHWELPGDALRAWWPFLCYSVLFYGLAVRLALLFFALGKTRSRLGQLTFNHADANSLWRRLTGPQITVRGGEARLPEPSPVESLPTVRRAPAPPQPVVTERTPGAPTEEAPAARQEAPAVEKATTGTPPSHPETAPVVEKAPVTITPTLVPPQRVSLENCFAVVAEELAANEAETRTLATERYGWAVKAWRVGKVDNRGASADLFADVRAVAPSLVAILVVIPATRDPIVAVALFLRELIKASDNKPEVIVHLVGDRRDGGFAPVDDARFEIWRRFRDIQRLRIGLER